MERALRQKATSFLTASMSKSMCRHDTWLLLWGFVGWRVSIRMLCGSANGERAPHPRCCPQPPPPKKKKQQ